MSRSYNISILYLSVGSGHQIAAESIAEALSYEENISVRVADPFSNAINVLPSMLERLQAASIALTPGFYDLVWRGFAGEGLIEWISDLDLLQKHLSDYLKKNNSDIVIATHVLPCAISIMLKECGLVKKAFGVVTDFGLHSFWPLVGVDGYFVGNKELYNAMVYRGADPGRIFISGIPIRRYFENALLQLPKVSEGCLRVLFIAGGVRNGAYGDVHSQVMSLINCLRDNIRDDRLYLTIVTGKQDKLREKLENNIGYVPFVTEVMGYVEDMYTLMASHDVLISKPGGLILAEALASGICPIIVRAGPGQESANANFLARKGVAFRGETSEEIVCIVKRCIKDFPSVYKRKLRAKRLGTPDAARRVAKQVLISLESNNS